MRNVVFYGALLWQSGFAEALDPHLNVFLAFEWESVPNFLDSHVRKFFEQRVRRSLSLVGAIQMTQGDNMKDIRTFKRL